MELGVAGEGLREGNMVTLGILGDILFISGLFHDEHWERQFMLCDGAKPGCSLKPATAAAMRILKEIAP